MADRLHREQEPFPSCPETDCGRALCAYCRHDAGRLSKEPEPTKQKREFRMSVGEADDVIAGREPKEQALRTDQHYTSDSGIAPSPITAVPQEERERRSYGPHMDALRASMPSEVGSKALTDQQTGQSADIHSDGEYPESVNNEPTITSFSAPETSMDAGEAPADYIEPTEPEPAQCAGGCGRWGLPPHGRMCDACAERAAIVAFLRRPVYRGMWLDVANAIEEGQHHEQ